MLYLTRKIFLRTTSQDVQVTIANSFFLMLCHCCILNAFLTGWIWSSSLRWDNRVDRKVWKSETEKEREFEMRRSEQFINRVGTVLKSCTKKFLNSKLRRIVRVYDADTYTFSVLSFIANRVYMLPFTDKRTIHKV